MPFTYTNRKGTTYTLYRKTGKDGKERYVFGRNAVGNRSTSCRLGSGSARVPTASSPWPGTGRR